MTLPGLRSRWITPFEWANATASQIFWKMVSRRPSGNCSTIAGCPWRIVRSTSASVIPRAHFIVKNVLPRASFPSSCTGTMLGCSRPDVMRASVTKRWKSSSPRSPPVESSFMATDRSQCRSVASYTTPIPPLPRTCWMRYFSPPSTVTMEEGG